MRSVVRWAINNTPAMNTLMVTVLIVGMYSMITLRRETFPSFELEMVLVAVPYPGASPDEVESGICQKIEEAIRSITSIKKVTSVAQEGAGNVVIELESDVPDVQKTLGEIEAAIDRIPSLPELAEDPEIQQVTMRSPAISVAVITENSTDPEAPLKLREQAERVREDLLLLPSVTNVEILVSKKYELTVEISEQTLNDLKLTLKQVADLLKKQNLELPGGKLKTESSEVLLRGKNRQVTGEEIAKLPLITKEDGVVLTVGDLGHVRDEFSDGTAISRVNGKPGLVLLVKASAREDLLAMTDEVKEYVKTTELPSGYEFGLMDDMSIDVRDRLELLQKNGLQGLLLVFLVLALFLDLKLAFWVALGIPISVLGAAGVLLAGGETMNMLSMFSFLIALGIVVDDAIVIGENIHAHREQGKPSVQAALEGTLEVLPSVSTSVFTTVLAFMPMFFVTGVMGKFFAVMPVAIIAMLLISLVEGLLILPCHLAHAGDSASRRFAEQIQDVRARMSVPVAWSLGLLLWCVAVLLDGLFLPMRKIGAGISWCSRKFSRGLDAVIENFYVPGLGFCLKHPPIVIATAVALLLFSFSFVKSGVVPWIFFPKLDARQIEAKVIFPNGTPGEVTDAATQRIEEAVLSLNDEFETRGGPVIQMTHRQVGQVRLQSMDGGEEQLDGSHVGLVNVELLDNTLRDVSSQEIVDRWREKVGPVIGAETATFGARSIGPEGVPIEFKLLAKASDMQQLEAAVEAVKAKLRSYPGVFDVDDDSRPGKWEYQLKVKEKAKSLNIPLEVMAAKVRAAYYGEEVMRLQRGRHEVKLMVRYPPEERESLAVFNDIKVDTGDGTKLPLSELAEISIGRGFSEINRINQRRSITISADVDEKSANAARIVADLQNEYLPELFEQYPEVKVRWEGQQAQTAESVQSLMRGFVIALLLMFVLLTLEFTSYAQPLIVMAIIPFGSIGAIFGHAVMGIPLTLFSVLGLVALTGVVVNDSIVLVDFINHRLKEGQNLQDALREAGVRRFRPVLLTSMTTIAGLFPLLTETSMQAQLLIPMATSLCFGLLTATFLVLFLIPTFYQIYMQVSTSGNRDSHTTSPDPESSQV